MGLKARERPMQLRVLLSSLNSVVICCFPDSFDSLPDFSMIIIYKRKRINNIKNNGARKFLVSDIGFPHFELTPKVKQ